MSSSWRNALSSARDRVLDKLADTLQVEEDGSEGGDGTVSEAGSDDSTGSNFLAGSDEEEPAASPAPKRPPPTPAASPATVLLASAKAGRRCAQLPRARARAHAR